MSRGAGLGGAVGLGGYGGCAGFSAVLLSWLGGQAGGVGCVAD